MKFGGLGLQGKFVVALLVAAALPFIVGLAVFGSKGYHYLLTERGKFHQMEALTLVRALDQASKYQGDLLRAWLAVDPALVDVISGKNRDLSVADPDKTALETRRLDEVWASLPPGDPNLVAVLENAGAASLRKFRALHPEVAEILATDLRGGLAAATGKTSDFDQADEAWWKTGATLPKGGQCTDLLRLDASSRVFSLDVIIPLHEGRKLAGVAKMSVDVTSLFSRLGFNGEERGERWEIVLPDGWVLASSKAGFIPLKSRLPESALDMIRKTRGSWVLIDGGQEGARMAGFVGMGPDGQPPNAYVFFSSLRGDVVGPLQRSFIQIGLAAAALLTVCTLFGFYLIHLNILLPLALLGRAARSISATARLRQAAHEDEQKIRKQREQAELDLHTIESIRTGDEVEALAGDLAVMTSRVLRYQRELESEVAAKTSVIREDLEMAREFQNALLPSHYPEVPPAAIDNPLRLQFAHFYQPASTVGGDFFDLIELDENRAGILIADVMGHGARSALITAILRALVRNQSRPADDPGEFLSDLNKHLLEVISRSGQTLFVTAFFLILDTRNGKASWAVAGHPAPLRVRRGSGKAPEPLWAEPQHQPALGLVADAVFRSHEAPLKPGDVFLLFTDGAIEAENPAGDYFGVARLAASFDEALDGPMAAMPAKIVCDVTAFQRRRNYDDDVCLVAVEAVSSNGGS
jgi:serine phosphatase RsbU (regulator of sigma subunit)